MEFKALKSALGVFSLTAVTAVIGVLGLTSASFAQSTSVNPLQEFQRSDNPDPLSGENSGKTMLDIIHNSRLGGFNIDYEAVGNQQRQNIQDAAAQFREKQRLLLQPPEITEPATDSTNPIEVQP
ncbi:hypothetical protein [Planktothrix paucivesiculata]|uniref:Uncharacterized protein n=1 Tax=Planktothrix paucivesiculata PCC 9631 TaxID=671071 RepID=A0A7Z9BKF9_9CYAN|nr:hypothetical protein [Planktothrix paucivesiculata]VXD15902.1 exported hypothetical protein [Planktothrix paucivesiculata PCC 9631]